MPSYSAAAHNALRGGFARAVMIVRWTRPQVAQQRHNQGHRDDSGQRVNTH